MNKKKILFITTGGTIASVRTPQGLRPGAVQRGAAGPYAGPGPAVPAGHPGPVQHRQHRHEPGPVAGHGPGHRTKLQPLRRFHPLPRHRHPGLYGGSPELPGAERRQAHHPDRRPAAHLRRDHRRQKEPVGQCPVRPGPRQPGGDGGVRGVRDRGHPGQKEQDHQLRRLCVGQFPPSGPGAGGPAGALHRDAAPRGAGAVQPRAGRKGLFAQADAGDGPRPAGRDLPPVRLRHRGELRGGGGCPSP